MNLSSPLGKPSCKNHSDVLLEIAPEILKENMNEAGKELYTTALGELPSKDPTSADFSFDCTGKIVDVVHKTLSCLHCKKMQSVQATSCKDQTI